MVNGTYYNEDHTDSSDTPDADFKYDRSGNVIWTAPQGLGSSGSGNQQGLGAVYTGGSAVPIGFQAITNSPIGSKWLDPKSGREYDAVGKVTNAPVITDIGGGKSKYTTSAGQTHTVDKATFDPYYMKGFGAGDWSPYDRFATSGLSTDAQAVGRRIIANGGTVGDDLSSLEGMKITGTGFIDSSGNKYDGKGVKAQRDYSWLSSNPDYNALTPADKIIVSDKIAALSDADFNKAALRTTAIAAHPGDKRFANWLDSQEGKAATATFGDVYSTYGTSKASNPAYKLNPTTGAYDPLTKYTHNGVDYYGSGAADGGTNDYTDAQGNKLYIEGKTSKPYDWTLPEPPQLDSIARPKTQDFVAYNAANPLPDWKNVDYTPSAHYGDKSINGLGLASYQDQVMTPMEKWNYEQTPAYKAKMQLQGEQLANGMNARGINSSQVAANANADLGRKLTAEDYDNEYNRALGLNTGNYTATNDQYGKAFAGSTAQDLADYTARFANQSAGYQGDVNQYNAGLNAMGMQSTADANNYNLQRGNLIDQYNINLGAYKDMYNTATAEADAAYNKLLNATKIGAGAAGTTAQVNTTNTNNATKITTQNGTAAGTAAQTVGNNNAGMYNGLGEAMGNVFKTIGLT